VGLTQEIPGFNGTRVCEIPACIFSQRSQSIYWTFACGTDAHPSQDVWPRLVCLWPSNVKVKDISTVYSGCKIEHITELYIKLNIEGLNTFHLDLV